MSAARSTALLIISLLSLSGRTNPTPLLTVAEAKRLSDDVCLTPRPFDISGRVLSEGQYTWFFRDETDGVEIHNPHRNEHPLPRGSIVRIRGELTVENTGSRTFTATAVDLLRHGVPDPPMDTSVTDILNGHMDFRSVRVKGVISSVTRDEVDNSTCWASLRTPSGNVFLTFHEKWNSVSSLEKLTDAEVVLTGLLSPIFGLRRSLGRHIKIDNNGTIDVISPPPSDPFSAPDLSGNVLPHRQKVRGIVIAAEPLRFFLKTNVGRIIPIVPRPCNVAHPPVVGDFVSAVGFARDDPYRIQLSDAIVQIDGCCTNQLERPKTKSLKSLFRDGSADKIDWHIDGSFIIIQGTVLSISQNELSVSDGVYALSIDVATLKMLGIPVPAFGSKISASGICLAEFETPTMPNIYPTFKRYTLIPRTSADITILETPPWWTPLRLTLLAIALGIVLLGSAIWNVMLKRESEKRGKELYDEKIDHALAEQKVEERTRLAVELHDSVSQTLTGVALQLDGGEVETAKTMLASCRGELRRCLWDLRSRTFEEKDLTEAVTRTITPHLNGCTATVRFNVPRERLSESLTHAILRIVRELVVNAIRHGQAKHIRIAGEMHENTVSFSVTDDGRGFDPKAVPGPEQGHFGLLGIRERIEDFNGDLRIASAPGKGAKFTVTLATTDETDEQ